MNEGSAYGLICTGDPDGIVTQARAKGYSSGTPLELPICGLTGRPATPKTVLTRNASTLSEWEQVTVGGSCAGHKTRVLLTYFCNGLTQQLFPAVGRHRGQEVSNRYCECF